MTNPLSPAPFRLQEPAGTGFRVEWLLSEATLLGDFPLYLDSLLAGVAFRREEAGPHPERKWDARHQLPLGRALAHPEPAAAGAEALEPEWVWAASRVLFLHPIGLASPVMHTRKTSLAHMAEVLERGVVTSNKATVTLGTGQFKAFLRYTHPQHFLAAVAYGVGDVGAVAEALRAVTQLGSHRRHGLGNVATALVVEDPRAHERWRWRVLPRSMSGWAGEDHVGVQATVRPDYFDRSARQEALDYQPVHLAALEAEFPLPAPKWTLPADAPERPPAPEAVKPAAVAAVPATA